MTVQQEQEQEQGQSAKRARSVAWGAGVAGVGFVAAVVFYEVLFGAGYRNNYFWWARAAEGALIGGGALLAWHVGRVRLAAVVGLVATVVLLAVGIALPATERWAMGQSPVIWGLLVPFAVRAVAVKQGGRDASEVDPEITYREWN